MSFPSPPLYIALRYLRSRKQTRFISVMTGLAVLGVTVGVAALTITLSVMNGFESEVRSRIVGADAHLRILTFSSSGIENPDSLRSELIHFPNVTGVAPIVHVRALLRYEKQTEGIMVRGVDANLVSTVSDLPKQMMSGTLSFAPDTSGRDGIILGNYLAERVGALVGSEVTLVTVGSKFSLTPAFKRFIVRGIFSSGFFEYDNSTAYIALKPAEAIAGIPEGNVTGLELRLRRYDLAQEVENSLKPLIRFPKYTLTWYEQNRTLFAWIQIEKWVTFTVLSLIILVAVVNIISSLVMLVLEKGRDIGILKAMGAEEKSIAAIFLWEGGLIGLIGAFLGSSLGFAFCWAQQTFGFFKLPGDVYFLDRMPIEMLASDFISVALVAIGLSLLAAWYPARRAAALEAVSAIRGLG